MNLKLVIKIGVAVFLLWLAVGLAPLFLFDSRADRGTFGDMFGAANALFSGLALAGVVCAILLQREELILQRRELELTRSELKRTSEAQASSAATLIQQQKIAEKNIRLQAYTALLQSCNDRISSERARIAASSEIIRRLGSDSISPLKRELSALEAKVKELIELQEMPGEPNKAPEPTPGAVTPRATEGASK